MEVIENFKKICEEGDGIMIARGDLGVELPYEWIPLLQKTLIHAMPDAKQVCDHSDTNASINGEQRNSYKG